MRMALGRGEFLKQFGFNNWPLLDEDFASPKLLVFDF
jgi:hypothetical protein